MQKNIEVTVFVLYADGEVLKVGDTCFVMQMFLPQGTILYFKKPSYHFHVLYQSGIFVKMP